MTRWPSLLPKSGPEACQAFRSPSEQFAGPSVNQAAIPGHLVLQPTRNVILLLEMSASYQI
jgi:hypothetical protein